jgi:O-antigen/teichoic acid export membrane protein
VFSLYDWPSYIIVLAALVVGVEHLNVEVCRMLVGEGRATLSILAMSARTGLWALALPLLSAARVLPFQWSETLVLSAWLTCSVAGLGCWAPLFRLYSEASLGRARLKEIYVELVRLSAVWVFVTLGWRAMENGGRLVTAYLLGDAQSGRFTLLSTIASFSLVATKGILEPMYFSRIVGVSGEEELRRFARATIVLLVATSFGSVVMALFYNLVLRERGISAPEWPILFVLIVAFGLMSISQIWHFRLYRAGRDRAILWASLGGGACATLVALMTTKPFGGLGAACGVLLGAAAMCFAKWKLARPSR